MHLYFAAAENKKTRNLLREVGANKFLVSYFSFKKVNELEEGIQVFLDSGAFSAWSRKKEIKIQDYISFIKKNKEKFHIYANLDVIGDPEKTLENQKIIEKAGLTPIPAFHYQSDMKYLKYYIDNYDYIALGGLVPLTNNPKKLQNWLNKCFKELIKPIHQRKLKVHGFGVTSLEILKKYPFYSVDSTSWLTPGKFGNIPILTDSFKTKSLDYKNPSHICENWEYLSNVEIKKLQDMTTGGTELAAKTYLAIEKDITKLWEIRGIKYED